MMDLPVQSWAIEFASPDRPFGIFIERRGQRDGTILWAVISGGAALGSDGRWEFEPLPSSRTDEYLATHRF